MYALVLPWLGVWALWCPRSYTPKHKVKPSPELMDMLVRELKEELEARSESKTGNKAWLRRRLHGAIVRAHLLDAAGV